MKDTNLLIARIVTVLKHLTPGALRRVLAAAERECAKIQRRERGEGEYTASNATREDESDDRGHYPIT